MKSVFLLATLSVSSFGAAYSDNDGLFYERRNIDPVATLRGRTLGSLELQPRGLSLFAKAGSNGKPPPKKPAGGSGLGHSRLPIPPSKIPKEGGQIRLPVPPPPPPSPPPPSGGKISKSQPAGAPKERFGWGMPSAADFKQGPGEKPPKPAGGSVLGKYSLAEKKTDKLSPALVQEREIMSNYLTRPGMSRPMGGETSAPSGEGDQGSAYR